LIGIIAGLLTFVPYLGPASGIILGCIAALVQYGDWQHVAGVLAVFGIGQVIESYWLTPKLVGDRIGLHPVAVIFAVLAGGQLFGFLGMLIALPCAAVANVLLRYAEERYTRSRLYAGESPGIVLREGFPPVRPYPLEPADEWSPERRIRKGQVGRPCLPRVCRSYPWRCATRPTSGWIPTWARRPAWWRNWAHWPKA